MTNLTGHPAMVVPAGFVDGLPVALMLTGQAVGRGDAAARGRGVRGRHRRGTRAAPAALAIELVSFADCGQSISRSRQTLTRDSLDPVTSAIPPARPSGCCGGPRPSRAVSSLLRYTFDSRLSMALALVLDDVELQLRQRAAHVVEAVLGLDDDFVKAARPPPTPRTLRSARGSGPGRASRAGWRQSTNRASRRPSKRDACRSAAAPDRAAWDRSRAAWISCTTLYDTGTSVPGSSGSGASAIRISDSRSVQPLDDLGRGLAARELAEELFDVLDLERAGLERVLLDQIFHGIEGIIELSESSPAGRPGSARSGAEPASAERRAVVRRRPARRSPASRHSSASTAGSR